METSVVGNVARKISKPKRTKPETPEDKPQDVDRKPMAIQMRAEPDWKACLERLAKFDGRSVASIVDRAVRVYAREIKFPEEFPER